MTARQILAVEARCHRLSNELTGALEELGAMASEALGYEVIADLCHGNEIEFRPVGENDRPDAFETIMIETVIDALKNKKTTNPSRKKSENNKKDTDCCKFYCHLVDINPYGYK